MRAMLKSGLVLAGIAAMSTAGCGAFDPPPPPAPFKASLKVNGDPNQPLFGVPITTGKGQPVLTGVDGKALLVFNGSEGDVREVTVTCPVGHQQISKPISIRLTRLVGDALPTYEAACPPLRRRVVVAIRAENGPQIPVKYLNQVVATTDEGGAAHFALDIEPGTFSVQLDTSARSDLRPPSPSRILSVGNRDDVIVLDQKFDVKKKYVPPPKKPQVAVDISQRSRG